MLAGFGESRPRVAADLFEISRPSWRGWASSAEVDDLMLRPLSAACSVRSANTDHAQAVAGLNDSDATRRSLTAPRRASTYGSPVAFGRNDSRCPPVSHDPDHERCSGEKGTEK
jgi:hypothetical protein